MNEHQGKPKNQFMLQLPGILANKAHLGPGSQSRIGNARLGRINALKQPGHISSQDSHSLKAFHILPGFLGLRSVNFIPVVRRDNGHLGKGKILVESIKRLHCSHICDCL